MSTEAQRHQERALLTSARLCYFAALFAIATFAASFFAPEPPALRWYSSLAEGNLAFLTGGRWYFLALSGVFVALALYSIKKANTLRREKPQLATTLSKSS